MKHLSVLALALFLAMIIGNGGAQQCAADNIRGNGPCTCTTTGEFNSETRVFDTPATGGSRNIDTQAKGCGRHLGDDCFCYVKDRDSCIRRINNGREDQLTTGDILNSNEYDGVGFRRCPV